MEYVKEGKSSFSGIYADKEVGLTLMTVWLSVSKSASIWTALNLDPSWGST